ncbi:hypothetical protein EDEG_00656 [Edhazardia aedis USNM 41457]|uniref:60S ribosomal protein L11 n=1 Tax=Edhazardia aedis (strain USNM 41457) TaxID=1003232 RepID=J9A064_EDHAE|nr:hypothetical protein EDEG_00656 [Edhazardia aedis USNM 41457]|eukprot:EJW05298.1 hypothetical protein EDEG_00656 [Edhazardia aedis USNM 41457]
MSVEKENPMREVYIQKLCINCCVGQSGDKLECAAKVLEQLTGQKPQYSKSKLTIRSFGIRRNEKIAVNVTVQGEKAKDILDRALKVKEYELPKKCFSNKGSFGFGIQEHIDLGMRYEPGIGIFGMDFTVVLGRKGQRVSKRIRATKSIGKNHVLNAEDGMNWFVKNYQGILLNK